MPADREPPPRLYQQVAARVLEVIRKDKLGPGARLPGENDLAARLGVSRPTVREALIALEIAGHIEVRSGSGSYVCEERPSLMVDAGPGPYELLQARILLEGEVAAECAAKANSREVAAIREAVAAMDEAMRQGRHSRHADREFHLAIAVGAHNEVLVKLVDGLWSGIFSPLFHTMSERSGLANSQQMARRGHVAVLKCIEQRDRAGAREAMRQHLREVESVLFGDALPVALPAEGKKESRKRKHG